MISTGTNIGLTQPGTGGFRVCAQKCLFALNVVAIKLIRARAKVTAMLPVTLAEPGSNPNRLLINMKKKIVRMNGA